MAIAGGLISIGQHFSHNFFMCIWVLLSEWFEYTYISSWDVNKKIKVVVLHLQSLWKTGLALWAFGDVGSDIYLTYTTYKPVGNLLFKSVNFCALFLILRHAKRPLCVMKSTIILWEALIPQSVRMSPFLLYPQIWKVTLVNPSYFYFIWGFIWDPQEKSISPYPMNLVQSWELVNAIPVATSSCLWSLSLVSWDIKSNH